jgi:hypothetical protein
VIFVIFDLNLREIGRVKADTAEKAIAQAKRGPRRHPCPIVQSERDLQAHMEEQRRLYQEWNARGYRMH